MNYYAIFDFDGREPTTIPIAKVALNPLVLYRNRFWGAEEATADMGATTYRVIAADVDAFLDSMDLSD